MSRGSADDAAGDALLAGAELLPGAELLAATEVLAVAELLGAEVLVGAAEVAGAELLGAELPPADEPLDDVEPLEEEHAAVSPAARASTVAVFVHDLRLFAARDIALNSSQVATWGAVVGASSKPLSIKRRRRPSLRQRPRPNCNVAWRQANSGDSAANGRALECPRRPETTAGADTYR